MFIVYRCMFLYMQYICVSIMKLIMLPGTEMANNPHERSRHHPSMPWFPWGGQHGPQGGPPLHTGVPPYGLPMFIPPIPIWEQPPPPMDMWYAEYFANIPVFRDREVSLTRSYTSSRTYC